MSPSIFSPCQIERLYAGLNLNGSYISVRDGLNKAYYGRDVTPWNIIVKQSVGNKAADR